MCINIKTMVNLVYTNIAKVWERFETHEKYGALSAY